VAAGGRGGRARPRPAGRSPPPEPPGRWPARASSRPPPSGDGPGLPSMPPPSASATWSRRWPPTPGPACRRPRCWRGRRSCSPRRWWSRWWARPGSGVPLPEPVTDEPSRFDFLSLPTGLLSPCPARPRTPMCMRPPTSSVRNPRAARASGTARHTVRAARRCARGRRHVLEQLQCGHGMKPWCDDQRERGRAGEHLAAMWPRHEAVVRPGLASWCEWP
jgi:hypothetical protein